MGKAIRILCVEDSHDDLLLLQRYLTRAGYDVALERVESPGALQAALARSPWDLVLVDYMVPGFPAPEALALLRQVVDAPPVVIISGAVGDDMMGMQVLLSGARDYLAKAYLSSLVPAIGLAAGVIAAEERPAAHMQLCQVYMQMPEPNLPKAVFHGEKALTGAEALGQWELYARAALALGKGYVQMGWAGDAVRVLQHYLAAPAPLGEQEGEVYLQLGHALDLLGDRAGATAALEHARRWFDARGLIHAAAQAAAYLDEMAQAAQLALPNPPESDDPVEGHLARGEYLLLAHQPSLAVREGLAALNLAGNDPNRRFNSYMLLMRGARVQGHHKEAMAFAASGRQVGLETQRFDLAFRATQAFSEMYLSLGAEAEALLAELEQEYREKGIDATALLGSMKQLANHWGAW